MAKMIMEDVNIPILTIVVTNSKSFMHNAIDNFQLNGEINEQMVEECLQGKREYVSLRPTSARSEFINTFIVPLLNKDGYLDDSKTNILRKTVWKGKIVQFIVFNTILRGYDDTIAKEMLDQYRKAQEEIKNECKGDYEYEENS
jgi:hypothetical protein